MYILNSRHGFAAAIILSLAVPLAQGSVITPDSILNPPTAVGSASGTAVPSGSLVSTQYGGLGLNFWYAAITQLDGAKVWAPVQPIGIPASSIIGWPPSSYPPPTISYESWLGGGAFVVPGTGKLTSVYSTTLEIMGAPVTVDLYNSRGKLLGSAITDGTGPHGGELYTFSGGNISSFSVLVPTLPAPDPNYPAWGVAEVAITTSPEPSSLVLASLGALGLAGRFLGRRIKRYPF